MAKLSTDKYNIPGSGSVIILKEDFVRIEIDSHLIVEFHFVEDETKGQSITSSSVDNKYLKVLVYNAKNMGATTKPVVVAEDDITKKKILLSLAFQKYEGSVLCHYTFFSEK